MGDHSSRRTVTRTLKQSTRTAGPESALSCLVPSLFDLAPGGVCRAAPVTSRAVRSYRTLSPFAGPKPWRFALCGTFPEPVRRPARRTLSGTVISVEPGLSSPGRIPHRRRSPNPLAGASIARMDGDDERLWRVLVWGGKRTLLIRSYEEIGEGEHARTCNVKTEILAPKGAP